MQTSEENILIVIPAKWASVRLPWKNFRKLHTLPLVCYAINASVEFSKDNSADIIISTEDKERAVEHLSPYCHLFNLGIEIVRRPKELAVDPYTIDDVVLHCLEQIQNKYTTLIILQADCPFTISEDIAAAYKLFLELNRIAVRSVVMTGNPFLGMKLQENFHLKPATIVFDKISDLNRDFKGPFYRSNGAIFVVDVKEYKEKKSRLIDPLAGYVMPRERSLEIDTPFDFEIARHLMEFVYDNPKVFY